MLALFLKGLLIGLAIAAPVGPIGVLCIQRSLHHGFKAGFVTGMGAATADGVYGLIAGFGLTAISSLLIAHQFWIRLVGGLFLLYLGGKLLIKPYHEQAMKQDSDLSLIHVYATTFFLTLTNPMTILSFMAVFAGLGLGSTYQNYFHALWLVIGVIFGSACWWLILSGGIAFILHKRVNSTILRAINWVSGIIILLFGVFALLA